MFACVNACVVYAWYMMKPEDTGPGDSDDASALRHAGDEPDPLRPADLVFAAGHRSEAVSMAVRVLRMHVTGCQGSSAETEVSDQDCRNSLLAEENVHLNPETIKQILSILETTERQRFAGEEITEEEWRNLTDTVRRLIRG